jgi:ferritin-like metal-binding protein YciE
MADPTLREAKLIQYLNEAYGKERELETALQAHIKMTTRDAYKKRLQAHLKETKAHARDVKARIRKLGGKATEIDVPGPDIATDVASAGQSIAGKAMALAQGPLHMLRGTSEQEKLLKNAKTEYADEAEEIATYTSIQTLAEALGDTETAKLAKTILRDEERMAGYLQKLIPTLTKAVVTEEIPAAERRPAHARGARSRSSSNGGRSNASSTRSRSRSSTKAKTTGAKSRKSSGSTTTRSRAKTSA